MLARVTSYAIIGIEAYPIDVEVDAGSGLPAVNLVGLADTAVKESRIRVKSAIKNSGFRWPGGRLTINLAPSHLKKEGAAFDLPIAVGVLAATGQVDPQKLAAFCFLGELSLDGALRPCKGVLPASLALSRSDRRNLLVSEANAAEASLVESVHVWPMRSLKQVAEFLHEPQGCAPLRSDVRSMLDRPAEYPVDFSEIRGQQAAKRAIEIAVSGGHNLVMVGPPGSGKTMLAQRIPTIMPGLSPEEALQVTGIHSVMGMLGEKQSVVTAAPFRMPHHSISYAGLAGGGSPPRPGEISLAHRGVLFLDELPEFKRDCLEALRQPLESGLIHICRTRQSFVFPASFMLVCAMNPCPCGFYSSLDKACRCSTTRIDSYINKLSGPLLDRIDLHIELPAVRYRDLADTSSAETSAAIRERVCACRRIQHGRLADEGLFLNAQMTARQIQRHCPLSGEARELLRTAMTDLGYSARAYDKIIKISRTIADMDGADLITGTHVAEAVQYRNLDRKMF